MMLIVVGLFGCSSPNPDFYTLYSQPGAAARNVAIQIEVRRPGLPGYLDRPNLVRRTEAGQLDISGTERWGTTLGDMVGEVLAENLTLRLPESTVYTEAGAISSEPDLIIEVHLQRFEAMDDGTVQLVAQVALHGSGSSYEAQIRRYELSADPGSTDAEDMVAGMSELLAELAESIARSVAERARTSGGAEPLRDEESEDAPPPPTEARL
jgi:hypothetical protein